MVLIYFIIFLIIIAILNLVYFYSPSLAWSFFENKNEKPLSEVYLENNDVNGAVKTYVQEYSDQAELGNNDIESLFRLVRIYRYGHFVNDDVQYKPSPRVAKNILLYIIETGDEVQIATAKMMYNEIEEEELITINNRRPKKRLENMRRVPTVIVNPIFNEHLPEYLIDDAEVQRVILDSLREFNANPQARRQQRERENRERENRDQKERENRVNRDRERNDTQNVHDSNVVRSIKTAIKNIDTSNLPDNWYNDLSQTIIKYNNQKAVNTLNKMSSSAEITSAYGVTQSDILKAVWSRINDPINNDIREDMTNILVKQLEDGDGYCTMGMCSRVMQTLEATDKKNTVNIRPEWALREEMSSNAAKIYDDMFQELNEETKNIILNDDDNIVAKQFKESYKVKLGEKFNEYDGMISEELKKAKINEFADAV